MNILALNYEYPPLGGGGGVLSEHVLEHLAAAGHSTTLITSGGQNLEQLETRAGVRIERVPVLMRTAKNTASMASMLSYHPLACKAGMKAAAREKFDCVLTFFAIPTGPAGAHIAKKTGIPNVLFLLGGDVYDPSKKLSPHKTPFLRGTVGRVIREADHVFAGSKDVRASALKYFSLNDKPVEVVPLSIAPFNLPEVNRADIGLKDDDVVITTIGRLVSRKNVEALIQSVLSVNSQGSPCRLTVMGDGPSHEGLQALIEERGAGDRIKLLGNVTEEDKHRHLAASDIYASTSIHEGFGLVFLEGMHAGLPVVCYDNGGQTDFVIEDQNGYVIKLNELDAFTGALKRLVDDKALRDRIKANNIEDVKGYYVATACQRYLEVIEQLARR